MYIKSMVGAAAIGRAAGRSCLMLAKLYFVAGTCFKTPLTAVDDSAKFHHAALTSIGQR